MKGSVRLAQPCCWDGKWDGKLIRYFCHQGMSADTAEDLAADVRLKVLRRSGQFNFGQSGVPSRMAAKWVYCVALNTLRDYARKRHDIPLSSIQTSEQGGGEALLEGLVSSEPSPTDILLSTLLEAEQSVYRAHILAIMKRGLDTLTPKQRMVVTHWKGKKNRPFLGSFDKLTDVAETMQAEEFDHVSLPSLSRCGNQAWKELWKFLHQEAQNDPCLRQWLRSWAA